MVNISERVINVVMFEQPKLLIGCIQNGVRTVVLMLLVIHVNVMPPANSSNLSYPVRYVELGKSVFLSEVRRKQTVRNAEGSADIGM